MEGKEIEHVPPVFSDANTRANTIANLAKTSRTEYRSNQIGQLSANKVRTWIRMGEQRREDSESDREKKRDNTLAGSKQAEGD